MHITWIAVGMSSVCGPFGSIVAVRGMTVVGKLKRIVCSVLSYRTVMSINRSY